MNAKLNRNDTNNNSSVVENESKEEEKINEMNGNREESPKVKNDIKDENCISQFLNSIINFRRDEMNFSLNNLLGNGNQPPANFLLNDLNRNFLMNSNENVNHALSNLVAGHQQYQKYGRGTCKWPGEKILNGSGLDKKSSFSGCDLIFDDLQTFTK